MQEITMVAFFIVLSWIGFSFMVGVSFIRASRIRDLKLVFKIILFPLVFVNWCLDRDFSNFFYKK